jgi:hemerythrin superfamily protein
MDAIKMLKKQHREVEALFKQLEKAKSAGPRRRIFEELADALAVHATIEERHFYPAAKKKQTEDMVLEAAEEHLEVKRVIADLLDLEANDPVFMAKVTVLKEDVQHHVEEEEEQLFPKVEKLLDDEELEAVAAAMQETAQELQRQGDPRMAVPSETSEAAHI